MTAAKVFARIERDAATACWNWTGNIHPNGYGRINTANPTKMVYAHRFSYEAFVGPIPPGLQIDHLCRNRRCVNPDHLEAVTPQENLRRSDACSAVNARKTHCNFGHLLPEQDSRGRRTCHVCATAPLEPDDPRHGKYTTYNTRRCRCDLCKAAMSERNRERYLRRNAQGGAL